MVKTKKNSFLMSLTSLILCVAMLIGSTFAWFTDTATSGANKIVAGNLDIDVQYKNTSGNWVTIEGSDSLFDKDAKWEPGRTEYVILKIVNNGSLAFNYKMMLTPVTEKGGVNVDGKSFKLSDYLVFGATNPAETEPIFNDAAAAQSAVSGLTAKVSEMTKTGTMAAGTSVKEQYIALVVYMPSSVGNEANYKTGTEAPEIELGIQVVATQLGNNDLAEKDSFDNTYDKDAVTDSKYIVGPAYDYFPQVAITQKKATSGDTVISYSEKLSKDDTAETILVKASVPEDALETGVDSLTVTVKPQDPQTSTTQASDIQVEITDENREVVNFDVKITGVKSDNATSIPMEVFVGKGLSNVKVYHKGTLIVGATYDKSTGIAKFNALTFSDYSFAYDVVTAGIGEKTYGSLELALNAAKADDTVYLLRDIEVSSAITLDKQITLDGQGYTIAANDSFADWQKYKVGGASQKYGQLDLIKVTGENITVKNLTVDVKNYRGISCMTTKGGTNTNYVNITYKGRGSAHYYGYVTGESTITFQNCKAETQGYAVHCSQEKKDGTLNVVLKDCELYGWNSFGAQSVSATGCYFGNAWDGDGTTAKNGNLAVFKPYCDTTLTNCTFAKEYTLGGTDGYTYVGLGTGKAVTVSLNNCNVDGATDITAIVNSEIFEPDAENGSVIAFDAEGNAIDGYTSGIFYAKDSTKIKYNDSTHELTKLKENIYEINPLNV